MVKINGKEIVAECFAYDGCHKIYLLNGIGERKEAESMGYEIRPLTELADTYIDSCGLRFIDTWEDCKSIIPQCETVVTIQNDNEILNVDFEQDTVNGTSHDEWLMLRKRIY